VLGHVLLGGIEGLGELPDRCLLALAKDVEQAQARGFRQYAEAAGDQLGDFGRQGAKHHRYGTVIN
jgi:hypothetical protein